MAVKRKARVNRKTKETGITLDLALDGAGKANVSTGLRFLDHMLDSLTKHSGFDLTVKAKGDVDVDDHHLVEDVGICLGEALDKALGDRRGIERMACAMVPMDESIATAAIDISGRGYAKIDIDFSEFKDAKLGDVSKENLPHFFESLAIRAKMNLHLSAEGANDHHKAEAAFKAVAKALQKAVRKTGKNIPSTKGKI